MNTASFDMPMWTCPACHKEQQHDEYYDLHSGDRIGCQYCEKEYQVAWTNQTFTVTIDVEPLDYIGE